MVGVAGPYDLLGSIRRLLPKTLKVLDGVSVNVEWYLDELPVTPPNAKGQPRSNPHGIIRLLSPIVPRHAVASEADVPYRLELVTQVDTIPFATDTLDYEITEQDIASVVSVIGTRAGVPNHVFVQGTDYTFDVDSFTWTGTGDLPDNGTNVVYTYRHRMYHGRKVMHSRATVRAIIKAQALQIQGGRHYSMETLAAVLGSSLELRMRYLAATRLVRPPAAAPAGGQDEPYADTITVARVLSHGPLPMDASGSLASWFVDFTLNIAGIYEEDGVQSILDVPFEAEINP